MHLPIVLFHNQVNYIKFGEWSLIWLIRIGFLLSTDLFRFAHAISRWLLPDLAFRCRYIIMINILRRPLVQAHWFYVVAYRVESDSLRTRYSLVNFGRYLQHFLVEFRQVILLKNFVNSIMYRLKKPWIWMMTFLGVFDLLRQVLFYLINFILIN